MLIYYILLNNAINSSRAFFCAKNKIPKFTVLKFYVTTEIIPFLIYDEIRKMKANNYHIANIVRIDKTRKKKMSKVYFSVANC